jgi:type II restriction/modification system DNA methylase subunit YeeA
VIVGNPPFLGNKKMIGGLGEEYVERMRERYKESVPSGVDLVCYWFARCLSQAKAGRAQRFGLVGTNSIRDGANRKLLSDIVSSIGILEAWADEPWVLDGAAVRVSLVVAGKGLPDEKVRLNGNPVGKIHANLSAGAVDITLARRLTENASVAFQGVTKGGAFEISYAVAKEMLLSPTNPNGLGNRDVIKPIISGGEITTRGSANWVIDFDERSEVEAALYESPFEYVRREVWPKRSKNRREGYRRNWWRLAEHRPGMKKALRKLERFIATPKVSKHRVFGLIRKSSG